MVSIVPAARCEVKHAASFAASSRWLSSPRQGSFILSNEAAKYAQVSFWKLTDGLCCWCVIIGSSRSFFTVGVLFVLFSFEFLDVPPAGQTTLTSVLSSFSSNTHIIFTTSFNIVSSCIKSTFQSEMDKTTEQSGEEAAPVFFGDACAFFQNKEAALRLLSGHFGLIDTDSEQSPDAFPLSKILNQT